MVRGLGLGLFGAFFLVLAGGCSRAEDASRSFFEAAPALAQQTAASSGAPATAPRAVQAPATAPSCADPVPVFEEGREVGRACPGTPEAEGLTVLDLSDDWAPWVMRAQEGHPDVGYRRTFVALADERERDERGRAVGEEPYLELFGIFPTFRVLRDRAANDTEHRCSAAVDDAPLRTFAGVIRRRGGTGPDMAAMARTARSARDTLAREASRRGLASIDDLSGDTRYGTLYQRYREAQGYVAVVSAVQRHLACEGMLARYEDGTFDGVTSRALTTWQRKNMLVSKGYFDEHSRDVMLLPSEERVFRSLLRALRERVVDATGLVEDGTAGSGPSEVLGRLLDAPELFAATRHGALPNAAPDLISPSTEAAAKALGWIDPTHALDWLRSRDTRRLRVAVRLPALPAYHSEHMELRAEIDRGDVRRGENREGDRRPTTVVFVRHEDRDIPLFRWNTTIGGYQDEVMPDGTIRTQYKESPAGPRIWRDVIAAPSWMPPSTTPDAELLTQRRGVWVPNQGLVGPGYRSAYGLLMVMHHKVLPPARDGTPRFDDEGVRSHGSVSYHSILSGFSHGCHRLYNHLALRLGGFLVRHRHHTVRGDQPAEYERDLVREGETYEMRIETRGYLYELVPPVDVNVLEGTVHRR